MNFSAAPAPSGILFGHQTASVPRPVQALATAARRHAWLLVLLAFGTLTVLIGMFSLHAMRVADERREAERWHVHTLEVLLVAGELRTATFEVLRGERGYLLTRNPAFLAPFETGRREAPRLLDRLQSITRDNPGQTRRLELIRQRLRTYLAVLDRTVAHEQRGDHALALEVVRQGRGKAEFERLQSVIDDLESEERRLLIVRREALDSYALWNERLGHAAAAIILILVALAASGASSALRAQRRAAATAEELRRMATVDELTGLPNRRLFLSRLEAEAARARRGGSALCLATLDIDHFKRINDRHGHPGGDAVLRAFSATVRDQLRLEDLIGRIGGEEFGLLLPDTDPNQAAIVCERIRQAVAADRITLPSGERTRVTVSTGIAALTRGEDLRTLMRRSDEALYTAKARGRNRVQGPEIAST